jgi:hypothetical protein
MIAEKPATGILQMNNWGPCRMYKVVCDCGDDDCTHTLDVEASEHDVTVTIYTRTRTDFWSKSRWQHLWKLLFKGYTDFETTIVMKKQVALNYADVLHSAVKDVEDFRNKNVKNKNS